MIAARCNISIKVRHLVNLSRQMSLLLMGDLVVVDRFLRHQYFGNGVPLTSLSYFS